MAPFSSRLSSFLSLSLSLSLLCVLFVFFFPLLLRLVHSCVLAAAAVANTLLHRRYRSEKRRSETRGPQVTKTKIIKTIFIFFVCGKCEGKKCNTCSSSYLSPVRNTVIMAVNGGKSNGKEKKQNSKNGEVSRAEPLCFYGIRASVRCAYYYYYAAGHHVSLARARSPICDA